MKFGIIRERKHPPDKRVVLSPRDCQRIFEQFPKAGIAVEPSPVRVYKDQDYKNAGITVTTKLQDCDVLLGVKEVPVEALIPGKKYIFFSHTIKKQPYNRALLRAVLEKNITLYDHELFTSATGERLVAFGRYAGIVGAYNGIRAYGLKFGLYTLPKAETLPHQQALIAALNTVKLPAGTKILLTGTGRVGNGAREMLDAMPIERIEAEAYLQRQFRQPVYCQIDAHHYNRHKDGNPYSKEEFHRHPDNYVSDFMRFAKVTDLFIAGHFYGEGAPFLFTREGARSAEFAIKVIA
ncbi:MAG: alanine dehydrogenase, partial [Sinomicrobium sp.]|nr:alanine dehydrogenase [Sinomicrobium sp.]